MHLIVLSSENVMDCSYTGSLTGRRGQLVVVGFPAEERCGRLRRLFFVVRSGDAASGFVRRETFLVRVSPVRRNAPAPQNLTPRPFAIPTRFRESLDPSSLQSEDVNPTRERVRRHARERQFQPDANHLSPGTTRSERPGRWRRARWLWRTRRRTRRARRRRHLRLSLHDA